MMSSSDDGRRGALIAAVRVAAGSMRLRLWAESLDDRPDVSVDHLGWIDVSEEGRHRHALEEVLDRLPAPELVATDQGPEEATVPSWGEGDAEWADAAAEFLALTGRLPAGSHSFLVAATLDHIHAWFVPDDHDLLYGADMALSQFLADVDDETSRLWHGSLAAIEGRPATYC